jgi:peptide/nickel transport system substrate-binding protein
MSLRARSRRLLPYVLVVVVAAAVALAAGLTTARADTPAPTASAEQLTLRIGWTSQPDNLNPFIGWQNVTYEIWSVNYGFLFGFGNDNSPTLDLAREFPTEENGGISADGTVWTIKLRQGVKWSDGQPFTAEDVAFTYNYIVKNRMLNMAITTVGIKEAEALAPDVVRITCSRPKADMMHIFLPILPRHVWEKVDPNEAQTSHANKPPIVGTGPFITTEFKKGSFVRMERNPYYWGTRPTLDELLFEYYTNGDTMTADLKSGAIDAAWGIPEAQFDSLASVDGIEPVAYNFFNWDYLSLNCYEGTSRGNPVLRDWRFRNALNYAVDRQALADIAYVKKATPGTTILPPGMWSDPDYHWEPPDDQRYAFDLAEAGRLLDEAGYEIGPNATRLHDGKPIELRLWTTTESAPAQTSLKLIAGWLKKLGLKIEVSIVDAGALQDSIWNFEGDTYLPDFDMYIWDWAGYSDPGQTLSAQITDQIGNTNEPCWSNAEYDALNEQQASELDPEQRKLVIDRMQQIMYEQTPWVVLTYPKYLQAYNDADWTGWTRMFDGAGPAFLTTGYPQSYIDLKPVAAETASGSGGGTTWVVIVAVVAVVLTLAATVFLRRRRGQAEEERS